MDLVMADALALKFDENTDLLLRHDRENGELVGTIILQTKGTLSHPPDVVGSIRIRKSDIAHTFVTNKCLRSLKTNVAHHEYSFRGKTRLVVLNHTHDPIAVILFNFEEKMSAERGRKFQTALLTGFHLLHSKAEIEEKTCDTPNKKRPRVRKTAS